jgi:hypothetical protein
MNYLITQPQLILLSDAVKLLARPAIEALNLIDHIAKSQHVTVESAPEAPKIEEKPDA